MVNKFVEPIRPGGVVWLAWYDGREKESETMPELSQIYVQSVRAPLNDASMQEIIGVYVHSSQYIRSEQLDSGQKIQNELIALDDVNFITNVGIRVFGDEVSSYAKGVAARHNGAGLYGAVDGAAVDMKALTTNEDSYEDDEEELVFGGYV